MKPSAIRRMLGRRPFRPLEFVLDNGEAIRVPSPEILVAEDLVMTVDRLDRAVVFSPESVSLIRHARGDGRARPRAKR